MKSGIPIISARRNCVGLLAMAVFASIGQKNLTAQPAVDPAHAAHVAAGIMPPDPVKGDPVLAQQISELQRKVAQLEATLAKTAPPMAMAAPSAGAAMPGMPAAPAAPKMSMGMDKMKSGGAMPVMPAPAPSAPAMAGMNPAAAPAGGMMGMMSQMMGMMDKMMPMGGASAPMPSGSAMPAGVGMGMMDMMGMGGGASMAAMPQSGLPGFPGASHLYHIGATGFFLDHPQHIALTTEQQAGLNKAKEQALLAKSTADRAIEQAEQGLWTLTAADQPDAAKIEATLREIEKLRADERLAFIRAVGDASKILTDEQRKILTGFAPPAATIPAAAPMAASMKM